MTDLTTLTPVEIDTELSKLWQREARERAYAHEYAKRIRQGEQGDRFQARYIDENKTYLAKHQANIREIRDEAAPFDAEYIRRGRWNRYFLVQNSNGHVHRGMDCSTCFITTEYSWLIDLADCDEDAMVEEYGEMACTVCFPDAPVHPAWARSVEEREAAEAAKKASKCQADPFDYDSGSRGGWARYVKCNQCGGIVSRTSTGKMRSHKPGQS